MKPLIVLHLFYIDLWDEFKNYFDNLNVEFDLYVSITGNTDNISETIHESYPDAKIFILPNKGLDVGPFLHILKYLKENNLEYSYIVKLHTKKSSYNISGLGDEWRKALVESLIGSEEIFKKNIFLLDDDKHFKMVGCKKWIIKAWRIKHVNLLDKLNIFRNDSAFVGGTMFIVDYKLMMDTFTVELLDELYNDMPEGYVRDYTIAHDMERAFGFIVEDNGYHIRGA